MSEPAAIAVYLNDHLAGASGAIDLAERMAEHHRDTELGDFLATFAAALKEDQATLREIMERLEVETSLLKQAGAWLGEKLSAVKLDRDFDGISVNSVLGLETLAMGVRGKILLWQALQALSGESSLLSAWDFSRLLARAQSQVEGVEQQRLRLVPQLLAVAPPVSGT